MSPREPSIEPSDQEVDEFIRQHGGDIAPFEDIAAVFGFSHQRCQTIARTALRRLHRHLLAQGLSIDVLVIGSLRGQSVAADAADLGESP